MGTNLDGSRCGRVTGSKPYCADHEKVRFDGSSLMSGCSVARSRAVAALSVPRRAALVSESDFATVVGESGSAVDARLARCAAAMVDRVVVRACDEDDELVVTADADRIVWFGSSVPVPYEDDIVSVVRDGSELRVLLRLSEVPDDSRERIRSSVHAMTAAAAVKLNESRCRGLLRSGDVEVYGSRAQALASCLGPFDGISYRDVPSAKWWDSAVVLIDRSGRCEVKSVARPSYEFLDSGELRTRWTCGDNEKWEPALSVLDRLSAFGWQADSSAVCVPVGWQVADFGDEAMKSPAGKLDDYL